MHPEMYKENAKYPVVLEASYRRPKWCPRSCPACEKGLLSDLRNCNYKVQYQKKEATIPLQYRQCNKCPEFFYTTESQELKNNTLRGMKIGDF